MSATQTATKPIREWSIEEDVAYLDSLKQKGNNEKIVGVGEFLHAKMGITVPTDRQTFEYHPSMDMHGNDTSQKIQYVKEQPDALRDKGITVNVAAVDHTVRRNENVHNEVPGGYILTIQGVSLGFSWGKQTQQRFDPGSGKYMVDVIAEVQDFLGRFKYVDPRRNRAEYLFWWMHPWHFAGPGLMSPDDQDRHGLSVQMEDRWYNSSHTKRISCGKLRRKEHAKVMDNADNVRICAELERKTEKELRKLAISAGLTGDKMSKDPNLTDRNQYLGYLNAVVQDREQTVFSKGLRDALLAAMSRGDEHTETVVNRAVKAGVLSIDGSDIYLNSEQPLMLNRYIVPPAAISIWPHWFATELSNEKASELVGMIDSATVEFETSLLGGRSIDKERIEAVDRAIATGTVKAKDSPKEWVIASTGQRICTWSGVAGNTGQQRTQLLKFVASYDSMATILIQLGLVEEKDTV